MSANHGLQAAAYEQQRPAVGGRGATWRRWLFLLGAILAVAAVLVRGVWLPLIGGFLVVADPLHPADAVVALSGGERERVAAAAALFNQRYAQWFVVTDWRYEVPGVRESYADLMRQEAIWQGVDPDRILVAPGTVETTCEEALAVRELAQERGWTSLIVVTDPYHTRRARMAFRDAFRGTGIAVMVRPVREHRYRPESWWQTQDGLRETWTEYLKLALYIVGCWR